MYGTSQYNPFYHAAVYICTYILYIQIYKYIYTHSYDDDCMKSWFRVLLPVNGKTVAQAL